MEIDGLKIDKLNGVCAYNDEKHVYINTLDKSRYVSVTTLIHNYCQEFDGEFWSSYKALQQIMGDDFTQIKSKLLKTKKFNIKQLPKTVNKEEFEKAKKEVLDSWDKTKNTACERGTKIHLEKELSFYDKGVQPVPYLKLGGSFKCERNYTELDLEKGIYPEYLVSLDVDGLKIAGQIDLFIKDGTDIYILDFKTNKKLDEKSYFDPKKRSFQMMKYPLTSVMDCNMQHYTMQLSTYAYLLQQINPEFNVKQLMIIHFDHDGNESHHVLEYKKEEVEKMLKHYKKELKRQQRKKDRQPIEY